MLEDPLVLFHDFGARRVLRWAEAVADHLEHQVVRGQREDDHHQSALTRRVHEHIEGLAEVAAQGVVTLGLALLGATEDRVELVHGLAGHEGAQQRHGCTHHRQVDVKIGTGKPEQRADVTAGEHHRVDLQPVGCMTKHDDERRDAAIADHAADDVGRVAAKEGRVDDFHQLRCGALPPTVEMGIQLTADVAREAIDLGNQAGEGQVRKQFAYRPLQ